MVEKSDTLVKNYWCISFRKLNHIGLRVMHRWERMTPVVKNGDAVVENSVYISFRELDHTELRVMHRREGGDAYLLDGGYHWSKNGVQWSKILCTCLLTNLIILE